MQTREEVVVNGSRGSAVMDMDINVSRIIWRLVYFAQIEATKINNRMQ